MEFDDRRYLPEESLSEPDWIGELIGAFYYSIDQAEFQLAQELSSFRNQHGRNPETYTQDIYEFQLLQRAIAARDKIAKAQ